MSIPIGAPSNPTAGGLGNLPHGSRVVWRDQTYERGTGDLTDWSVLGQLSEAQTFTVADAATNTSVDAVTLQHATSNTAADNFGVAMLMQAQNDNGDQEDLARISAFYTDVTDGTEDTKLGINLRAAGGALAAHTSPDISFSKSATSLMMETSLTNMIVEAGSTAGILSNAGGTAIFTWATTGVDFVVGATDFTGATAALTVAGNVIGGTGRPQTAAQDSWLKVKVGGNDKFIPLWD